MRFVREPFVQFLALGGLLFLAYNFSQSVDDAKAERRISIDGAVQDWMYSNFRKQFRRPPTHLEMRALIRAHIDEEVKYREALAMGLDELDVIVRRRMMQKFDFLFGNAASDVLPQDAVLGAWYDANPDEFMVPATISFSHLWFSPDMRGKASESDAAAALEVLRENKEPVSDRFPFEVHFDKATSSEVRNVLGPEFTQTVFEAPIAVWSGPIRSGLGYHLVRVIDKTQRELPPLDGIRDAVLERWREDESERILAELVINLKAQFEIEIDEESLVRFNYAPESEADAQ